VSEDIHSRGYYSCLAEFRKIREPSPGIDRSIGSQHSRDGAARIWIETCARRIAGRGLNQKQLIRLCNEWRSGHQACGNCNAKYNTMLSVHSFLLNNVQESPGESITEANSVS
jgi:hypothetical protein